MDSIDVAMTLCSVVIVIMKVILELKLKEKLTRITIADVIITSTCLIGMVYEASIASDFKQFLEAETLLANILRTFKCPRLFLLFL